MVVINSNAQAFEFGKVCVNGNRFHEGYQQVPQEYFDSFMNGVKEEKRSIIKTQIDEIFSN